MRDAEHFYDLLTKAYEGNASPQEAAWINRAIKTDREAARYYIDFFDLAAGLTDMEEVSFGLRPPLSGDNVLMSILAVEEKAAPAVAAPAVAGPAPRVEEISVAKPAGSQRSRVLSLPAFIVSAAAYVFILLYINLTPPLEKCAETGETVDPEWVHPEKGLVTGNYLYNNNRFYQLESGLVTLEFGQGAKVVLEGPCEFSCQSDNGLFLRSGKACAEVPAIASGFTIDTPSARIVDVGTEFGVQVETGQASSVHMLNGQALLMPGQWGKAGAAQPITAGRARSVDVQGRVKEIPMQPGLFVRRIAGKPGLAWKGQNVSLADMVGGGNGFGTGHQDYGIVVETGQPSQGPLFITGHGIRHEKRWDAFCPVTGIPGIDGIFIPDGGSGPVIVSSRGHRFDGCPDTNGCWSGPITNGARPGEAGTFKLMVDDVAYGTPENPAIYLHANMGITFDLNAIRALVPDNHTLARFSCLVKAPTNPNKSSSLVDVWVLTDGCVRFSKTNIGQNQSFAIDVPLTGRDGFLSCAVTDGMSDTMNHAKNERDWCFFCRPELVIEPN